MPPWPHPAVAAFFDEQSRSQKLKLPYTLCKITRYFLPLQKVSKQHISHMAQFINPFTDWGFKHIFGRDISKDLLIDFLNSLFAGKHRICDLTFNNTEQQPETRNERMVVFDIYCTDDQGKKFIVEMQNRSQPYFIDRAIYYAARAIVKQGEKGEWDYKLVPVYTVCFMNFEKFFSNGKGGICETDNSPNERLFRIDMVLSEENTKQCLTDKVHFTFLQLPAFEKDEQQCQTDFERWIYILNHMETFNRMPFLAQSAVFKKLAEISDISTLSKEEHEKYDESIKNYRDTMAAFKETRAEGQAEAKREIARNLLKDAIPYATIAAWTGLTEEEIAQLNAECDA